MQLLLKNKANVNVTNRDGENLLRAAFESNEAQRSYMGIIVDLVLHAKKNENVNLMDFVYGANLRLTSQKDLPTENSEEMRLSGELRLKLTLEHVFKNSKSHRKEFFDAMKDSNPIIAGKIAVLWDTLSKKESVRVEELDKSGPAPIPTKPIVEKPPSDNVQGLGASK